MQQVLCTGTGCCIRACIQRGRAPRWCVRAAARPVPAGNPCITPWRPETFVGYGHLAAGTCHASHVPRNRRCRRGTAQMAKSAAGTCFTAHVPRTFRAGRLDVNCPLAAAVRDGHHQSRVAMGTITPRASRHTCLTAHVPRNDHASGSPPPVTRDGDASR